jgi:hypothetical protein
MRKEYGPSQGREMIRGLAEAGQEVKREELMKKLPLNHTLRYLCSNGILPTVRNYIQLDTLADASTLDDLGPETRAEVEGLIEDGLLIDTINEFMQ